MRTLIIALLVLAAPAAARAESVGIGVFIGEPTGFDLKIGLGRRSALDIVIGQSSFRDGRVDYAHVTYLVTPFVGRGGSVLIPFRLGIGAMAYGIIDDRAHLGVRAPLEIGFRFRSTPLEIYGELALEMVFVDDNDDNAFLDLGGGIGIRFYF
ncbi:MAG: hypothetical protein H0X17_20130 [Deltaproteobacteria bacterium]|nr:hypothetical protein [Deltaproteobacteria bacterium]